MDRASSHQWQMEKRLIDWNYCEEHGYLGVWNRAMNGFRVSALKTITNDLNEINRKLKELCLKTKNGDLIDATEADINSSLPLMGLSKHDENFMSHGLESMQSDVNSMLKYCEKNIEIEKSGFNYDNPEHKEAS